MNKDWHTQDKILGVPVFILLFFGRAVMRKSMAGLMRRSGNRRLLTSLGDRF